MNKHWINIILVHIFITILVTFPIIFHLRDKIIGDGGDNYEYYSYQLLTYINLRAGKLPFAHSDYLFYPNGFELSLVDGQLVNFIGGVANFFISPPVVYNLSILAIFILNGVTAYLFFVSIFNSWKYGLLASIIYGYSYQRLAFGAGFTNLLPVYGLLLAGYALVKVFKENDVSWKPFALFFIACLITALCSLQLFLIFLLGICMVFINFSIFYKSNLKQFFSSHNNLIKLTISGFVFTVVFVLLFRNFLILFINNNFIDRLDSVRITHASAYYLPNRKSPTLLSQLFVLLEQNTSVSLLSKEETSIDRHVFFGFVEILLVLYYLFMPKKSKLDLFMLCNFTVLFLVSQGKIPIFPNWILYNNFPFKGIYETYRLFVLYYLFLTYCVVKAASHLAKVTKKEWTYWLLTLLIILERVSINYYLSPNLNYNYNSVVKSLPGETIMSMPLLKNSAINNVLTIYNGKKNLDGYTHWASDSVARSDFIIFKNHLSRFLCDLDAQEITPQTLSVDEHQRLNNEMLQRLTSNSVNYIVLNKNIYQDPKCANVKEAGEILLSPESKNIVKIYEDNYAKIYKIQEQRAPQ